MPVVKNLRSLDRASLKDRFLERPIYEFDGKQHTLNDISTERKNSTSSSITTEQSKSSSKKVRADFIESGKQHR